MHIDKFPGALTIIGAISAIFGFYLLQKAERQREQMKLEAEANKQDIGYKELEPTIEQEKDEIA